MKTTCIAGLCFLLLEPASLFCQTAPGALRLDGHRLLLGTDSFAVYLIRGADTTRTGSVLDQLSSDGRRLTRVYRSADRILGDRVDTIISRLTDLRPIAYGSRSSSLVAQLSFDTAAITGWARLVSGDSVPIRVPMPGVVYDGASFDLVARSSELRDGLELIVPSFLTGPNTIATLQGHVDGTANVDGRACWVFKGNFAGMPVTFWIDKASRALRRQLMQFRVDEGILFAKPGAKTERKRAT